MAHLDNPPRPFGALLTAMVTPFHEDGALDLAGVATIAQHLADLGHDGIVVNGTTGESPTTSDSEKTQVIEATREAVGGSIKIVAGVGTFSTAHSVELAKRAVGAGADGLLVVSPYYSKPSQAGLVQHFLRVADATDLPNILYDIPGRSAVKLEAATLRELAIHDRIVAVKDATGDVASSFAHMVGTGLAYYAGDDALGLPMLAQGGSGIVSVVGHLVGDRWKAVIEAVDSGDLPRARHITAGFWPVIQAVMGGGQGAVMIKAGLEVAGVLPNRTVRLPLAQANELETGHVREALAACKVSAR